MFKPKKEDDARSMVSNVSKTSKNILDMSINELLSVRIPVARASSKIEEEKQEKPTPAVPAVVEQEEERRGVPDRRSVKVE
jgi:hypothetical protein